MVSTRSLSLAKCNRKVIISFWIYKVILGSKEAIRGGSLDVSLFLLVYTTRSFPLSGDDEE